jgi:hypothetical protein
MRKSHHHKVKHHMKEAEKHHAKAGHHHEKAEHHHEMAKKAMGKIGSDAEEMKMARKATKKGSKYP